MAATTGILNYNRRPCVIVSSGRRRHKNPNWGWVNFSVIRYLDGRAPVTETVTAGRLAKARRVSQTEAVVWRRVDDLIRGGMEPGRALEQGRAEVAKGLMTQALF